MTRGQSRAAWIFGLLAGAAGVGGAVYYVTRPKTTTTTPPPGGGGGTTTKPAGGPPPAQGGGTLISPTATPGVFAAITPGRNVSWVDSNGKPIGGGGGGIDTSTARIGS